VTVHGYTANDSDIKLTRDYTPVLRTKGQPSVMIEIPPPTLTEIFQDLAAAALDVQGRRWRQDDVDAWFGRNPDWGQVILTEEAARKDARALSLASEWCAHLDDQAVAVDVRNGVVDDLAMTIQSSGDGSGVSLNKIPGVIVWDYR
jgi:hypothetical protein